VALDFESALGFLDDSHTQLLLLPAILIGQFLTWPEAAALLGAGAVIFAGNRTSGC
jgi:hypothetical protein